LQRAVTAQLSNCSSWQLVTGPVWTLPHEADSLSPNNIIQFFLKYDAMSTLSFFLFFLPVGRPRLL